MRLDAIDFDYSPVIVVVSTTTWTFSRARVEHAECIQRASSSSCTPCNYTGMSAVPIPLHIRR